MMLTVHLRYWVGTELVLKEFLSTHFYTDPCGAMFADNRMIRSQSGYFDGFPVESVNIIAN